MAVFYLICEPGRPLAQRVSDEASSIDAPPTHQITLVLTIHIVFFTLVVLKIGPREDHSEKKNEPPATIAGDPD
jgi:hypothetical protein